MRGIELCCVDDEEVETLSVEPWSTAAANKDDDDGCCCLGSGQWWWLWCDDAGRCCGEAPVWSVAVLDAHGARYTFLLASLHFFSSSAFFFSRFGFERFS